MPLREFYRKFCRYSARNSCMLSLASCPLRGSELILKRIEAVVKWKQLKNVSEIQSFLGLAVSFEKLKSVLTQAPVLVQPESSKEFFVYNNA
ncbi:RNA-directed DNA polymerase-like protein [Gossypium australe]|uniref:RNA-directed DNA polymerase-like protein n=1 Tax=Gossypium australe TaxID=47621 RepID=A0A5B6VZH2_9ROSI|nr:RNA-directed DNA polymerase-like protein [Gossypium australe]